VRVGWSNVRAAPKFQPTENQERNDQCGNQHYSLRAPDDGHSSARNMLSL